MLRQMNMYFILFFRCVYLDLHTHAGRPGRTYRHPRLLSGDLQEKGVEFGSRSQLNLDPGLKFSSDLYAGPRIEIESSLKSIHFLGAK